MRGVWLQGLQFGLGGRKASSGTPVSQEPGYVVTGTGCTDVAVRDTHGIGRISSAEVDGDTVAGHAPAKTYGYQVSRGFTDFEIEQGAVPLRARDE